MKKIALITCLLLIFSVTSAHAFLYSLQMLSQEEIKSLSDDQLMDSFMEAKIEDKASAEFHNRAGFSNGKEFNKRKDLLRYIIYLRQEMAKRDLEAPPIDEWLR